MTDNTKILLTVGTNDVLAGARRLAIHLRDHDELDLGELRYIIGEIAQLQRIVDRENARAAAAPAPPKSTATKKSRLRLVG